MAGLTGRMSTVVKAKVSKLLDRAEDPAETLDYSYQKQVEQLQNVKKGIADVVTAKKRLQMQEELAAAERRQARHAGPPGALRRATRTSPATALERKNVAQTELQSLDTQVTELEDQQQKLTDSEQKLRAKIEAFRTKKEVIKAQYSAAEAQVRISEAATGVGEQMADVGLAMQRAVDKTENMKRARRRGVRSSKRRARSTTSPQLGSGEDDIDRQLKQLSSQPAVDDELAKMKGELGGRRRSGRGARRADQIPAPTAEGAARRARAARHDRPHLRRGSVRLADGDTARLNELDNAVVAAVEAGDEERFASSFATLLDYVRANGTRVGRRRARGLRRDPAAARHVASRRPPTTSPARA